MPVAFRIDFAECLQKLQRRDRRIICCLIGGERGLAVAHRIGLSANRVLQSRRKCERERQEVPRRRTDRPQGGMRKWRARPCC